MKEWEPPNGEHRPLFGIRSALHLDKGLHIQPSRLSCMLKIRVLTVWIFPKWQLVKWKPGFPSVESPRDNPESVQRSREHAGVTEVLQRRWQVSKAPGREGMVARNSERRDSHDSQKRKVPANRKTGGNQMPRRRKQETKNYDPSHPAAHCHAPRVQRWCLIWRLSSSLTPADQPGSQDKGTQGSGFLTAENWTQSLGFACQKYHHWVTTPALDTLVCFLLSILKTTLRVSWILGKSIHDSGVNGPRPIFFSY